MAQFSVASVQMTVSFVGNNIPNTLQCANAVEAPFREHSAKRKIWLCPVSYFLKHEDPIYNHTVMIDLEGKVVGDYNKNFMAFDPQNKKFQSS